MTAKRKNNWFEADKDGLAKVLNRRGGRKFVVFELWQNVFDQNITEAKMTLKKVKGKAEAIITIEDNDPEGFHDLSHTFTLFAESGKKNDPTKRGRFNLGEKLVLACCREAKIISTTGCIKFKADGTRVRLKERREIGTLFTAVLKCTNDEYKEILEAIKLLVPPPGITCTFNGQPLCARELIGEYEANMLTEIADDEGYLKESYRTTMIRAYKPRTDETPMIYEMGIPVVDHDHVYHLDVQQKIPLNMDRTNVRPAYLRELRSGSLNALIDEMPVAAISQPWAQDGLGHYEINQATFEKAQTKQYGDKVVSFDPNDNEANKRAVANGYTVLHGSSRSSDVWSKARDFGAIKASGKLFPTRQPYSEDPNGTAVKILGSESYTEEQRQVAAFAVRFAKRLMGVDLDVRIVQAGDNFAACYGKREDLLNVCDKKHSTLDLNTTVLPNKFFKYFKTDIAKVVDVLIHEFGHEYCSDHLDDKYHEAITRLGAKAVQLALSDGKFFKPINTDIPVAPIDSPF